MLPRPDCVFAIPSLHDGIELDGRLYFPRQSFHDTDASARAIAIIAHPYAPMGGSWDDPVVHTISARLLELGFIVNTFNFRGAAGSAGNTSWTGNGELADYVSMLVHMLHFFNAPEVADHFQSQVLLVGGYSYGSMIASCLPKIDMLQQYMDEQHHNPLMQEIASRALEISQTFLRFVEMYHRPSRGAQEGARSPSAGRGIVMGGYGSESANQQIHRESFRRSFESATIRRSIDRMKQKFSSNEQDGEVILDTARSHLRITSRLAFLLISPILPPVAGLITLFNRPTFACGRNNKNLSKDQQRDNLRQNPALVIAGSKDMFTSSHKLKRWAEGIQSAPVSKISYEEVPDAGHFWREPGAESLLVAKISTWCTQLMSQ